MHASNAAGHSWLSVALSLGDPAQRGPMHGFPYLEVPANEPQEAPNPAPPDTPPARPLERPGNPGPREIPLPSLWGRLQRRPPMRTRVERAPFVRDQVFLPYRRRLGWR